MIQAVFFDLDHTLYDRNATLARLAPEFLTFFQDCFDKHAIDADQLGKKLIESDRLNYLGWSAMYGELEKSLPWTPPGYEAYAAFLNEHMGLCAVPYPETHAVLQWCRDRGLCVGMVTNGRKVLQDDKIDTLGIRGYFSHIVISGVFGAEKPDPAIFLHAAELAELTPQSIVFVGDNPRNDILASAAVGMVPIWLDHFSAWPEHEKKPDFIAHRLGDVPGIVEKMI